METATGNTGWAREILVVFGLLSILVAAVFIFAQRDVKRLLAYSSVEHLGIISLGVGIGGLGTLAALFHMLNHSLCKVTAFCCAGRLGQIYGTHEMRRMTRIIHVAPVWGGGLTGCLLALIGAAPFAIFLSEFLTLKAAVDTGSYWLAGLFLAGLGGVFLGALRHTIAMAWNPQAEAVARQAPRVLDGLLVFAPLAAVLVLGVWLPPPFLDLLTQVAKALGGGS